jgi:hypothetical protein
MRTVACILGIGAAIAAGACGAEATVPTSVDLGARAVLAGGAAGDAAPPASDAGVDARPATPRVDGGAADGAPPSVEEEEEAPPPPPKPEVPIRDATGCTPESEPNDDPARADRLPGGEAAFCGSVTEADRDHAVYVLSPDAAGIGIGIRGTEDDVEATVTVNGMTFRAGDRPVTVPGAAYVVRVTSRGKAGSYRVTFVPR